MTMPIVTAAAECSLTTAEARALLDQAEDSKVISLGVLSGADLCVLGGTGHPVCWEPLKRAWRQLDKKEQDQLAGISTLGLLHRGLIRDQPPGKGVRALILPARYKLSGELAVLLSARRDPALIIATHHESRTPAITYFQPQGTSAVVEEIPERMADAATNGVPSGQRSPLDLMFSYRLLTQDFAAAELARWALKPIPVARFQPRPPRLVCFFSGTGTEKSDSEAACQLTIYGDGEQAHVDGPDICADLGSQGLTRLMTDTVTTWAAKWVRTATD